ncbi:MAG: response regulator, partial [Gammaproteobacteria bacterium]|nr:response regulator [Gammaproteobacteria bacterium]
MVISKPARIVIVDIPGTARSLLENVARTLEPGAVVESYAEPAVALAQMQLNAADLIITDSRLPGCNGNEFIRHIRSERSLAEVPVLLVTLAEDRQLRSEAMENGVTDFLFRPL